MSNITEDLLTGEYHADVNILLAKLEAIDQEIQELNAELIRKNEEC